MTHRAPGDGAASAAEAALPGLVRRFDRDPDGNRRRIRQLLDQDLEAFYRAAIDLLRTGDGSAGRRCVISMLMRNGLLLRVLCDPALSAAQALGVTRMAVETNPAAAVNLARALSSESAGEKFEPKALVRLINLLTSVCEVQKILPYLRLLMRHSDPHVRSKAVLLVGRCEGAAWLQARMSEPDPRVRASAVEALGELRGPEVEALLLAAAMDDNNRVAVNALLALYRLGYADSVDALVKMTNHQLPQFRASAAWAMGMTKDPQFVPVLARMVGSPEPAIRRPAFAALQRIRKAAPEGEPEQRPSLGPLDRTARREELLADLPGWQRTLLKARR